MNEVTLLENYVTAHLDDRLAARVLLDRLEEQPGWTHWQALRRAAGLRKATRDAAELAQAAAILGAHDRLAQAVESMIRTAGSEHWRLFGTILVVPGSRYPSVTRSQFSKGVRGYWKDTIRVGARRVLRIAEAAQDGLWSAMEAPDVDPSAFAV